MAQEEVFSIMGSVLLKDTEFISGLKNVLNQAEKGSKSLSQKFEAVGRGFQNVGSSVTNLGKKVTAGTGAMLLSIGALTKKSIEAYADYEQLVGGVETLFGKSSGKVVEYAQGAYKTAGMSANDYMETVTSFSASLLQSLKGDTNKASEYSHRAVTDMSDNANKMGTDMSLIQNAYQGFAKQNYTMLDNLKLGYGGTKTEMARLVKDASKLKGVQKELGVTVDGNSLSFANIVNAISVVQKNMGIMGTTSKEAEKTISGSITSMKSAWTNLLIGMADDNADFEDLFNKFIDSVFTVAQNLAPRIEIVITTALKKILQGIKDLTGNLPPVFSNTIDKLIQLVENFSKLDGAQKKQVLSWTAMAVAIGPIVTLAGKLISGFGGIFNVLSKITGNSTVMLYFGKLKTVLTTLFNPVKLFSTAFGGLKTVFASVSLFGSKVALLFSASGGGLGGAITVLNAGVTGLLGAFGSLLGTLASAVAPVLAVAGVIYVLYTHWDKVVQAFKNFAENIGLTQKLQEIKDKIQPLLEKVKGLKDLLLVVGSVIGGALSIGFGVLMGLFNAVLSAISPLLDALGGIIDVLSGIGSFIVAVFTGDMEKAKESIIKIKDGIVNTFKGLWEAVKGFLKGFVDGVVGFFKGLWDTLVGHSIVPDTINSIVDWFKNLLGKPIEFVKQLKDKVVNFFSNLKDSVVNKAKELGTNISNKFNDMKNTVTNKANELKNNAVNKFNELKNKATEKFNELKSKATEKFNSMKTTVVNKANEIKNNAVNKFNELKNNASSKFESLKSAVSSKFNSIKSTISSKVSEAKNTAVNVFNDLNSKTGGKLGALVSTVASKFSDVTSKIKEKMGGAKDTVSNMLGNMKSSFSNFTGKLKMPHIKITGSWDLKNLKFPKFSVQWYRKGGIFSKPTLFDTDSGLKGVGEAGPEAVAPITVLQEYVADAVKNKNAEVENKLDTLIDILLKYIPSLTEQQIVLDTGIMVGALTSPMDRSLGNLTSKRLRGR